MSITWTKPTKFQLVCNKSCSFHHPFHRLFLFLDRVLKSLNLFHLPSLGKVFKLFKGFSRSDNQHVHVADTHRCLKLRLHGKARLAFSERLTLKTRYSGFVLVRHVRLNLHCLNPATGSSRMSFVAMATTFLFH